MRGVRTIFVTLMKAAMLVTAFNLCAGQIGVDFSWTDQDGRTFQLSQLHGKVVLLFFGYTYCPDICPTELAASPRC